MPTFQEKHQRKETKTTVKNVRLFQYGNGYRVQYTKTDKDINATHLLAHSDKEYSDIAQAEQAYEDILDFMELP